MPRHLVRHCFAILFLLATLALPAAAEDLKPFDVTIKGLADHCAAEVADQFELLLTSGRLTTGQLFDTFYIPVPNTEPQKYHTQYDQITDAILQPILDKYLGFSERIVFVVAVDRNGYLPTHNSRYSQPLTGDRDVDTKRNRTKRMFNDRTGLAAARNTGPYLLQRYSRDTGESMSDFSVPIFIHGRHWGALRIGYQ
jgi:methyl-accepting chemotaxis protein